MSEHHATIHWKASDAPFEYKHYTRDHTWSFKGDHEVAASAAPAFLGSADRVDPEDAFVAALSSCHMLTFLALAAKQGFQVEDYRDEAVGFLEKDTAGGLWMSRVELRPEIRFGVTAPTAEQLDKLHHEAHGHCFIAKSVKTEVTVRA